MAIDVGSRDVQVAALPNCGLTGLPLLSMSRGCYGRGNDGVGWGGVRVYARARVGVGGAPDVCSLLTDPIFILQLVSAVKTIREQTIALGHCGDAYECVIVQGSGTFGVESVLASHYGGPGQTGLPKRPLICINGA